ncbi:MAG: tRNA dihydrouridine synthase DusB [Eubacteriaceae bacterium]|jgi:tRNA-dihydrouridine synthase B|nr:tRNA dihydrouridine synthase DusB [Eubacteriaceae bacterium]
MNQKNDLKIGALQLESPFIAAPLAGITDAPTRLLCREMGAALTYSEMISGKGLMYGSKNTERLLKIYPADHPCAYQIFGSEPAVMAWTAHFLDDRPNEVLDINCGCPVPKIVKNGEGSALMKNLDLLYDVVKAVCDNTSKPVTVKMRAGWSLANINAPEAARAVEAAGASAVAVHGRTREQYYEGAADWGVIAEVKKAVSIPVIGNGDIMKGEDALRMMDETGCDFVMIARGMLGNPWIFRDALALWNGLPLPPAPSHSERVEMMVRHYDMLRAEKGDRAGVREMRKFVGWYIKGFHGAASFRRLINTIDDPEEMRAALMSCGE